MYKCYVPGAPVLLSSSRREGAVREQRGGEIQVEATVAAAASAG